MTTVHGAYEELSAGYALGALEPYEMTLLLEHLPVCLPCRTKLTAYVLVTDELPYATSSLTPPTAVLEGIRQAIRADARQPLPTGPVAAVLPLRRRASQRRVATWLSAAASLALIGSLAATNVGLRADRDSAQQAPVRLSSTVSQPASHRRVVLRGPDGTLRGVAMVGAGQVSLVLHGLAPNDSKTSSYALMRLSTSGAMERVGTFNVDSNELTQSSTMLLPDASSIKSLIIMLSPAPAMPKTPGGTMVAVGQLS